MAADILFLGLPVFLGVICGITFDFYPLIAANLAALVGQSLLIGFIKSKGIEVDEMNPLSIIPFMMSFLAFTIPAWVIYSLLR